MIVDDSEVMRGLLRTELGGDPGIEVVAHARNGRVALPRVRYYRPDIVLLDVEMPEMDGIETLQAIRSEFPKIQVIMFSARTERSARHTIRALGMGAVDFVIKPEYGRDGDPSSFIRSVMRTRIHSLQKRRNPHQPSLERGADIPGEGGANAPGRARRLTAPTDLTVCGIGVSTGGPVALRQLLAGFPGDFPGTVLVVQHMPPVFTKLLAESLDADVKCRVLEAADGDLLQRGTVYIAPGGRQMELAQVDGQLRLRVFEGEPELNCRPSVNVLFRSLANVLGERAAGVIMTGMGHDGTEGMKAMHARGSYLLSQDKESCVIYGMPDGPNRAGIIDETHALSDLGKRIVEILGGKP